MHRLQSAAQLGDYLRSLRKARGLTQSELGAYLGVSAMRISTIERNPESVSFAQLMRVLSILGARLYLDDGDPVAVSEPIAAREGGAKRDRGGEW